MMEPDGPLPLFGLDRLKEAMREGLDVMLHEGPKSARNTQALVANGADHPWIQDLRQCVHLGWPGGVGRSGHVDWEPLKRLWRWKRLILACDRDVGGENVQTEIARRLRRPMMALTFDDNFGEGFDLADPWPDHKEWWRDGRALYTRV